jgi:gliding motility-associated protein GldM
MGATNCPETPRQKMITMMYLVYTAMLALNVSAEVVNGFKTVGSAMTKSNENIQVKLDETYANFSKALQNSPEKVQEQYNKAQKVRELSIAMGNYIDSLEYTFMAALNSTAEVPIDIENPKKTRKIPVVNEDKTPNFDSIRKAIDIAGFRWLKMDELHESSRMFIDGGAGLELKNKIIEYKHNVKEILGEDSNHVSIGLNVEQKELNPDNELLDWEVLCFSEVVSGSALVTLTRLKAETMNAEFDAVNMLYKQVDKGDFKFDQIAMISRPKSTYIIQGGVYETDINVAAYDSKQHFTATVNGQQLSSTDSGSVHYRTVCNTLGVQRINGIAYVTTPDGGTQEYPIKDNYFVAKPVAVVSLDNMQVMYAGIENPFTASVPGVDGRNVKVSIIEGSGKLSPGEGEGKYNITPATGCKKIVLGVDAVVDKKTTRMGAPVYKVKPIPNPSITVGGFTNGAKVSRSSLASGATVIARPQEGFEFKIPKGSIRVMSLEVFVGNKPFNMNGNSFDPDLISAIKKANRGDKIYVDAKVMMPDGVPRTSSCILTINK